MENATAFYRLPGLHLAVRAAGQSLSDAVDAVLGAYAAAAPGGDGFEVNLDYDLEPAPSGPRLREFWSGVLPDGTPMVCRGGLDRRQFELPGQVRADLDLATRRANFSVNPRGKSGLIESCFLPVLCDCLARVGHYVIHAASLVIERKEPRRALVIPGVSGRGKTTLALALAGAGLELFADDVTFFHPATARHPGQVWGIRTRCKVPSRTLELLPWLRHLPTEGASLDGERLLDSRRFKPCAAGSKAEPGLLLFLNPRNPDSHRIEPLDKVAALSRLTRENIRAFDARREGAAGRAFDALAELVRSSRTFQASLCSRLGELPGLLASL